MTRNITKTMDSVAEAEWVRRHKAIPRCEVCGYADELHLNGAQRYLPQMREAHADEPGSRAARRKGLG